MLHRAFQSYGQYKGPLDKVRKGVLISMAGQGAWTCYLNTEECPINPALFRF